MASATRHCTAPLLRQRRLPSLQLSSSTKARSPIHQQQQLRHATGVTSANAAKYKRNEDAKAKRKKQRVAYVNPDLSHAEQFSLCDAMRYIRAFEVGYPSRSAKYELHIRLRTLKNGPVVRNRFRLPHPVDTSTRICVVAPADSPSADAARAAGATLVGEEEVFDKVKAGEIEFDRCICHADSLAKLQKAGVGRALGPRGLMPSVKAGTVVRDVGRAVREAIGGSEYRERAGVVRMAVGQLGFSPEEMQRNVKTVMDLLKRDIALLSDRIGKEIHEVVLSSTRAPGFSLNGEFKSADSPHTAALARE